MLLAIIVYIISSIICVYYLYCKYMADERYNKNGFADYIYRKDYELKIICSYMPIANTFVCFILGIYFLCKYLYDKSHQ